MRGTMKVLLAMVISLGPLSAMAEGDAVGMRFDTMPVGCEIHGRYGNGEVRVATYVGKKGGKHVTRSYTAGKLVVTTTYDAKGRMTRKDWAAGGWDTFQPYSCFSLPGACQYRYRNGDDKTFVGKVVKRGKGYVSSGGFQGEAPFADTRLTLGPFNDISAFREGDTSFEVIEYRNCGSGS